MHTQVLNTLFGNTTSLKQQETRMENMKLEEWGETTKSRWILLLN
jgi:hypothetical protein